jgi:hypothetical protein
MKRTNQYIWFLIAISSMLTSCLTTSKVSIQILQPARFVVPNAIQKISLADNSNLTRGRYFLQIRQGEEIKQKTRLDSSLSRAFVYGLIDVLYNSPRFVFNEKYTYKRIKSFNNRFDLMNWEFVKAICDKDTSDALIALEYFTLNDSSSVNVVYQPETGGYYGSLKLTSVGFWRIYYPYADNKYTDFTVRDTIKWDNFSYSSADVALAIPDRQWALEQASYKAGRKFGGIIAQQWKSVDRFIYDNGNMDLRFAADLANSKKWKEAIDSWKEAFDSNQDSKRVRAALAYNIAVGSEVLDNLDEALNWAASSYQINPTSDVSKYITELEKRKKEKLRIVEQMSSETE